MSYACSDCERAFGSYGALMQHCRDKWHDDSPYCLDCDRFFASWSSRDQVGSLATQSPRCVLSAVYISTTEMQRCIEKLEETIMRNMRKTTAMTRTTSTTMTMTTTTESPTVMAVVGGLAA